MGIICSYAHADSLYVHVQQTSEPTALSVCAVQGVCLCHSHPCRHSDRHRRWHHRVDNLLHGYNGFITFFLLCSYLTAFSLVTVQRCGWQGGLWQWHQLLLTTMRSYSTAKTCLRLITTAEKLGYSFKLSVLTICNPYTQFRLKQCDATRLF